MANEHAQRRPRLLLVEDSALLRNTTARALSSGYEISAVGSGEEALGWVEPGAFAVVLTDFRMPAMTGIELLELLRLRDPQLRRVLMSASHVAGLAGYTSVGLVHAFLRKPFDLAAARRALAPAGE